MAVITLVGALPALAGLILNGVPSFVTEQVARRFDATRVALIRIGAGGVSFALWYALLATAAATLTHARWAALAAPLVAMGLGACALFWGDAWRELGPHLHWLWLGQRRRQSITRLRRERAILMQLLERAPMVRRESAVEEVVR